MERTHFKRTRSSSLRAGTRTETRGASRPQRRVSFDGLRALWRASATSVSAPPSSQRKKIIHESWTSQDIRNDECGMLNDELRKQSNAIFIIHRSAFIIFQHSAFR